MPNLKGQSLLVCPLDESYRLASVQNVHPCLRPGVENLVGNDGVLVNLELCLTKPPLLLLKFWFGLNPLPLNGGILL